MKAARFAAALLLCAASAVILTACAVAPWNALNDDQRSDIRDATSTYQQGILSDLVVDETEYHTAVDDWRDCVTGTGAALSDVTADDKGLTYGTSVTAATDADVDAINKAVDDCVTEYIDDINRVWVSQADAGN